MKKDNASENTIPSRGLLQKFFRLLALATILGFFIRKTVAKKKKRENDEQSLG